MINIQKPCSICFMLNLKFTILLATTVKCGAIITQKPLKPLRMVAVTNKSLQGYGF